MEKFSDIDSWVFDLDNTLYSAQHNLFAQIDTRMTSFISDALDVSRDEAYRVQKEFLHDYGTTLAGLMNRYKMAPDSFLDFVHDIDVSVLAPDMALRDMIGALPGRKFIFTNGTTEHADRVAKQLGIRDLFDDIFDIVCANYVPKPNAGIYPAMLAKFGIEAHRTAFFEDMARNLPPARALGMTTVLLRDPGAQEYGGPVEPEHIDHQGSDVKDILSRILAYLAQADR
ncbi:MAG: pyrimidine 5'-nucleotidase [Rhizobiales bacterium TMED143]|nr:pyrimidine 5'-nucleotidase [Rhodobiaceae bacterium]MBL6786439.1 pyrimidine 5'-nucleotidase [PS1 clade bacterium]OUV92898.1 MAG: pyrimidine 5'-nucleotidase [Rhizobiales bacterium TMED143]CAI8297856.1 MAG: Uncharacterised protein [Rhodobiaceae bacterium UBA7378]HCQ81782.1 pyrimidine 5'-nucleotidase [Rhodobiaceae bacterium]|tara:strand:+ start:63 stop:746 length:684 start_codon:yes stop_codon:yes gene_type:complete